MDMFQIDWWHQEVDKMQQGLNQGNVEYITTFYKNVSTAISKVTYGMELKANSAKKKLEEAKRNGASEKVLKMIERSGKPGQENIDRLAGLEELMTRFVSVQVKSLLVPIKEKRKEIANCKVNEQTIIELDALSRLREELMSSPYYKEEQEEKSEKDVEPGQE